METALRDLTPSARTPHYPCTGRWAGALHRAAFHGPIWRSRQADLHRDRRYHDGLARIVLELSALLGIVVEAGQ